MGGHLRTWASIRSTARPPRRVGILCLELGQQAGATKAPGWGMGQLYKRKEGSPLVMEGMSDEGLSAVCLPLDTGITLRGGKSWRLHRNTSYSRGSMPSVQATTAGPSSGWSPCPAVGRRTCCQECSSSRVRLLHQVQPQSQLRWVLWADRGSRKTLSSMQLQKEHWRWSIKHINFSGCCQESDDSWWVPWAVLLLMVPTPSQEASAFAFPAPSVMDRCEHWKRYTLVSHPAALLVCKLIFHTASEECSTPVS